MSRTRSSIAGRVDVTTMMLRDQRITVRIYIPADYERTDHEYPVLYMFDAHNLFDRTTSTYDKEWGVDETMEWIGADTEYTPAIVAAIDAPQTRYERFAMYSLGQWDFRTEPGARRLKAIEGYGDQTAEFLMKKVKRHVERTYRASRDRDQVGVGGSSMGGYMSLYIAARYPQLVSKVIAFSPVLLDFPLRGDELREYIVRAGADLPQRFYLEMGDRERIDFANARQLVDHFDEVTMMLEQAGHREVFARIIPGGRHDERHWAKQFPGAFLWTFYRVEPEPWV